MKRIELKPITALMILKANKSIIIVSDVRIIVVVKIADKILDAMF